MVFIMGLEYQSVVIQYLEQSVLNKRKLKRLAKKRVFEYLAVLRPFWLKSTP